MRDIFIKHYKICHVIVNGFIKYMSSIFTVFSVRSLNYIFLEIH